LNTVISIDDIVEIISTFMGWPQRA